MSKSSERPEWWPPRVGRHALERYQEHYPAATLRDVIWDLAHGGRVVDAGLIAALTCAPERASGASLYVAGMARLGVFVLERSMTNADVYAWTIVTYLRFEPSQRAFLEG